MIYLRMYDKTNFQTSKNWKLTFSEGFDQIEPNSREKNQVVSSNFACIGENFRKNMGGCQKFGWKNPKYRKIMGRCQKFGQKKSKIWKKSGGGCDFGPILENIPYGPGLFFLTLPLEKPEKKRSDSERLQ